MSEVFRRFMNFTQVNQLFSVEMVYKNCQSLTQNSVEFCPQELACTQCLTLSLFSPPCPMSANVSSVKPDHRDNHHSSAISTKSLADSECEEMLCCQLEGSDFSPDEWRKGSVTPVNDPQRPLVSCPGTTQWPPLRFNEKPKWPLL